MAHLRMVDESEVEGMRWSVPEPADLLHEVVVVAGNHPRFGWCCVALDIDRPPLSTTRYLIADAVEHGKRLIRAGVTDAEYSRHREGDRVSKDDRPSITLQALGRRDAGHAQ